MAAKLLITERADLSALDRRRKEPLHRADSCRSSPGGAEMVGRLGAKLKARGRLGRMSLREASKSGNERTAS